MRYPNHTLVDIQQKHTTTYVTSNWIKTYRTSIREEDSFNKTANCLRQLACSKPKYVLTKRSTSVRKAPSITLSSPVVKKDQKANSLLWSLFDINFIKKEKIYTKLKYSRCPQYDIVSGGVAALFAGFIGFLISEKFGIEMVDSGDFYTFFMYCVFFCFSCKPFLKVVSESKTVWNFFSLKPLFVFLKTAFIMTARALATFFSKYPFLVQGWLNAYSFMNNNNYFLYLYRQYARLLTFLKNHPMKGYETFKW